MTVYKSPGWPARLLVVLLLPVPPALFLACPLWAEEPQASAAPAAREPSESEPASREICALP